jgi:hypothetical protein
MRLVFFALATLFTHAVVADEPAWEKLSDDDGIEVFRREVPGSPVVAFRGNGIVKAPIVKVASIIADPSRSKEWIDHLEDNRVVRRISPTEWIEYSHVGTPIVMKDRDFVSKVTISGNAGDHTFLHELKAVDDAEVPETSYVRGKLIHSRFFLRAVDGGTWVECEVLADPMGSVPKWVVNLFQKGWARNTIESLRKQAAREDIAPKPEVVALLGK